MSTCKVVDDTLAFLIDTTSEELFGFNPKKLLPRAKLFDKSRYNGRAKKKQLSDPALELFDLCSQSLY
jgi:hypothetical protein